DHELRRNILLTASARYGQNLYKVGGSQSLFSGEVGASYLLNRYAAVSATYDFISRQGTNTSLNLNGLTAGADFVDHRALASFRLSF
ncbi:MAG: outer membrane beta-barrel protein, partial [Acetobacteraceae bacterium]|nr:outer membrane beta-barrel protein [Acetobacteraceae bacterium]